MSRFWSALCQRWRWEWVVDPLCPFFTSSPLTQCWTKTVLKTARAKRRYVWTGPNYTARKTNWGMVSLVSFLLLGCIHQDEIHTPTRKTSSVTAQRCTAHAVPFTLFWWGSPCGLVGGESPCPVPGQVGVPLSSPRSIWGALSSPKVHGTGPSPVNR